MTRRPRRPGRAAATVLVVVLLAGCLPAAGGPPSAEPSPGQPVFVAPTRDASTGPRPVATAAPEAALTAPTSLLSSSVDLERPIAASSGGPDPLAFLDPPPDYEGVFSIELYRKGDFVTEATKWYCVPAAIQTMINIMSPGADRSRTAQDRFYRLARKFSTDRLVGRGAEPEGWATVLEREGFGRYRVVAAPSRTRAIEIAAKALRMTGKPVGLLVWRGAHSWVMSGFRATADPAVTDEFRVTHVDIEDVWYPMVSSIWGASRPPGARVPVERLPKDYLRWKRPTVRYPEKDGKFVLIVPVADSLPA